MTPRDIRSLDIGMLRAFDALMRERSVSRAATRLFLSQPAVSAALNRLRATFDDPLFTRTAHGVLPTARAMALAPHVDAVLADVQRLLHADKAFDPAASDRVFRIAGSDHASRMMLPAVCARLTAGGSRIRLLWESTDYALLGERLRKGDIDLGVLPRLSTPAELACDLLYEDAYCAVARHGHPRLEAGLDLDLFCELPHVTLGYGRSALDELIDQLLARQGRRRHAQAAVTSFSQMAALLAATEQVAVFPQRVARHHAGTLAAHPLPLEVPHYRLYLCWHPRAGEDPGVQWLKQQMLALGREPASS